MKKIIIVLTALALGVGAYAKTADELAAEYKAISSWSAQVAFVETNEADLTAAFNAWKNTDLAKYTFGEAKFATAFKALSAEQKELNYAQKQMFQMLYRLDGENIADIPVRTAINLSAVEYLKKSAVSNPSAYSELKNAGFVVDGVELTRSTKMSLSIAAEDEAYLSQLTTSELSKCDIWVLSQYYAYVRPVLLQSPDKLSYDRACALETAVGDRSDSLKRKVNDLVDTVYLRLTRANKIK